jgi:anti-sigma B factor antagonist
VTAPWPRPDKGYPRPPIRRRTVAPRISIAERPDGSTVRLELHGEIDVGTVGQVRGAVAASLARHAPSTLVLDFCHVSSIDSIGVGELVSCQRTAAARGATLMLENLAPFPHRQLWASGLLRLFGLSSEKRPATGGGPP